MQKNILETGFFVTIPKDQSVLDEGEEHKENAIDHPDVERLDVTDAGRALADSGEHGGQGEQSGHADGHSARNALRRHQKREPRHNHEHQTGDVGLQQVVADAPPQPQGHGYRRIAPCTKLLNVMKRPILIM